MTKASPFACNVAERYGDATIKTQAAAIAKLPRYKVSR